MKERPIRTIEFKAGVEWRVGKYGEIFAGQNRSSRGLASSPPVFGGPEGAQNPEELLLGSIALCQMLSFLHFVEKNEINLISYKNDVDGTLTKGKNGFSFTNYKINIDIEIEKGYREKAEEAIHLGHRFCLVSNSLTGETELNFTISEIDQEN